MTTEAQPTLDMIDNTTKNTESTKKFQTFRLMKTLVLCCIKPKSLRRVMSSNHAERSFERPNLMSELQRGIGYGRAKMLDIDGVHYCERCHLPLLFIEEMAKFPQGEDTPIRGKNHWMTAYLANKVGAPAYVMKVVLDYIFDEDGEVVPPNSKGSNKYYGYNIKKIELWKIAPVEEQEILTVSCDGWKDFVMEFYEQHESLCSELPARNRRFKWNKETHTDEELPV